MPERLFALAVIRPCTYLSSQHGGACGSPAKYQVGQFAKHYACTHHAKLLLERAAKQDELKGAA